MRGQRWFGDENRQRKLGIVTRIGEEVKAQAHSETYEGTRLDVHEHPSFPIKLF
jgi:hypothetical protein